MRYYIKVLFVALTVFFILFFMSCATGPEPIRFGEDMCSFCKMTIMDQKFGAEIVTAKGKVYKFDAAECMLGFADKGYLEGREADQYLVVNTSLPGTLIDATASYYLISENFPSPMGGNISAYETEDAVNKAHDEFEGEVFDWDGLRKRQNSN